MIAGMFLVFFRQQWLYILHQRSPASRLSRYGQILDEQLMQFNFLIAIIIIHWNKWKWPLQCSAMTVTKCFYCKFCCHSINYFFFTHFRLNNGRQVSRKRGKKRNLLIWLLNCCKAAVWKKNNCFVTMHFWINLILFTWSLLQI